MAHIMSDSGSACSEEMKGNFVENSRSNIVSLGERVVTKILDDKMKSSIGLGVALNFKIVALKFSLARGLDEEADPYKFQFTVKTMD